MIDPGEASLLLTTCAGGSTPSQPEAGSPPISTMDGQVWGDFRIGGLLGRGGMGAVYLARQLSMDRAVALKVLPAHLSSSEDFKRRFQLEARVVGRISSPHVIQIYAAGMHGDHHYFAMEYVEGSDLASRLRSGDRPSANEAIDIAAQAARGLIAAAEHAVVHRDIKPGNIMITARGQVKLMDFGLLTIAREDISATVAGVVMGTVGYLSPEQARGERCDHRTDIYSLGVLLYELLTGRLPFTGEASVVIHHHINTAPTRPSEIDPSIPKHVEAVVLTCLAKRPGDRYPSAAHLLSDLEALQADNAPAVALSLQRSTWPWWAVIIVLVTGLAIVGARALRADRARASTPIDAQRVSASSVRTPAISLPQIVQAPPVTASCGSAATVRAPFVGGDLRSFSWSIDGDAGRSGWLDAHETTGPKITWIAPGRASTAILRVVARDQTGARYEGAVALAATAPAVGTPRAMTVFTRRDTSSPALTRLSDDADHGWWGIEGDQLCRIEPRWSAHGRVTVTASETAGDPVTARSWRADTVVLRQRALEVLAENGSCKRTGLVGTLKHGSDLVVADDGTMFVSDMDAGLFSIDADGAQRAQVAGATGITRMCVLEDGSLCALAAQRHVIERFTHALSPVASWPIADGEPIDLVPSGSGVAVLYADGRVGFVRSDGTAEDARVAAAPAWAPTLGAPSSMATSAGGSLLIAWPDGAAGPMVTRLDAARAASLHGGSLGDRACSADGRGRAYRFDSDGTIAVLDCDGWRTDRIAAVERGKIMPFDQSVIAVAPDGRYVAGIDARHTSVTRLSVDEPSRAAVVVPARIGADASAQPLGLALDDDAHLYVLERDSGRIAVSDGTGAACFAFGGWGREAGQFKGPIRFAVSPRGGVAYVLDEGRGEMMKFLLDHGQRQALPAASESIAHARGSVGLGCDRQGLLYLIDGVHELSVMDWRTHRAETVWHASLESLGVFAATTMAVSPDGQVYLIKGAAITGLRW